MKWINGLTAYAKVDHRENWHQWFAWYPVCVGITPDRHKIKVWWESVERRGTFHVGYEDCYWTYDYREKT